MTRLSRPDPKDRFSAWGRSLAEAFSALASFSLEERKPYSSVSSKAAKLTSRAFSATPLKSPVPTSNSAIIVPCGEGVSGTSTANCSMFAPAKAALPRSTGLSIKTMVASGSNGALAASAPSRSNPCISSPVSRELLGASSESSSWKYAFGSAHSMMPISVRRRTAFSTLSSASILAEAIFRPIWSSSKNSRICRPFSAAISRSFGKPAREKNSTVSFS